MNFKNNVMLLALGLFSFGVLYPTDTEEAVIDLILQDYADVDEADQKAMRTAVATIIHNSKDKAKLKGLASVQTHFKDHAAELAHRFTPAVDQALANVEKSPTANNVKIAAGAIKDAYVKGDIATGMGL